MGHTARVHLLFRGASEVTKTLRLAALLCELAAAVISLITILTKPKDAAAWSPLAILGLAILGTGLRAYSSVANGFAQRCRRISLRAFCGGEQVDNRTVSLLDDEVPPFVEQMAAKLPAKSMEEYYEPTTPPGPTRYAELYAHSAFYTWRLLRFQALMVLVGALVVFAGCAVLIYHVAAEPENATDRRAVLEAVCTVVLVVFTVKGVESAWSAHSSSKAIRSIENALLAKPTGETLKDLVDSYDIERAAGTNPMTFLYNLRRDALSAKWNDRRNNFVDAVGQAPTPAGGDA